ncbi:hypothetical protein CEXT_99941 [Caerostris extrusa]|uniref:Uncharacterized protein n=1 Tax=Caerostris extrusa TaxID=172846 RepID=A0AAV4XVF6_CAEEX|nr:hypothetical protein CEXT_99941 [Caerostris extrusa]
MQIYRYPRFRKQAKKGTPYNQIEDIPLKTSAPALSEIQIKLKPPQQMLSPTLRSKHRWIRCLSPDDFPKKTKNAVGSLFMLPSQQVKQITIDAVTAIIKRVQHNPSQQVKGKLL